MRHRRRKTQLACGPASGRCCGPTAQRWCANAVEQVSTSLVRQLLLEHGCRRTVALLDEASQAGAVDADAAKQPSSPIIVSEVWADKLEIVPCHKPPSSSSK